MALAEYFERNAVSVSQLLLGYDEQEFKRRLEHTVMGLSYGPDAVNSPEGRLSLDLLVRLLARLYPTLVIEDTTGTSDYRIGLEALARSINPAIDLQPAQPSFCITVGSDSIPPICPVIYVGSRGWDAHISPHRRQRVGASTNPFGAGAAACLAAANAFRHIFVPNADLDDNLVFSTRSGTPQATKPNTLRRPHAQQDIVLVGNGAVGNAIVWAIANIERLPPIHVVDPQTVELSNLQRYVLATMADRDGPKTGLAARHIQNQTVIEHPVAWDEFVATAGYDWAFVVAAVDSAEDRRAIQATLPRAIFNGWTQPGDLGASVHGFSNGAACLSCLYLPTGAVDSDDIIIARALKIEPRFMQVRELLYQGAPAPADMLDEIAAAHGIDRAAMHPFATRPIRDLYVSGFCGGALVPATATQRELHVPLAAQSALAGILVAASLVHRLSSGDPVAETVTRLNVLAPVPDFPTQVAAADTTGRCICNDPDFQAVYAAKYE